MLTIYNSEEIDGEEKNLNGLRQAIYNNNKLPFKIHNFNVLG